jgi:glycosyltransferase involved in cell wall biosynthesis
MKNPKVSVIIPAYNQAAFLSAAIQSVLKQTYSDFEIIVVNDASPDETELVVKQFDDPRVKYIAHDRNRGLPAARNTGTRASRGELVAHLDADDLFHPEKLRLHVDFLAKHPEIGASYNSRFELNHSAVTIRELVRPPLSVTLANFVLGYPFTPSDTVVRRDWLFKVGLQNENYGTAADDLDLKARLALAGCKFANVDRALNFRRHHSGRIKRNLETWLDEVIHLLNTIFSDPRCPAEVLSLREIALATNYLVYGQFALVSGELKQGQDFIQEAIRLNPALLEGNPSALLKQVLRFISADENLSHETLLKERFEVLPAGLLGSTDQYKWAVGYGYLLRGVRAIMWNRAEAGVAHFSKAYEKKATIDESFLQEVAYQLFSYELEFGADAAMSVLDDLAPYLSHLGDMKNIRRIKSLYLLIRAFHYYGSEQRNMVPGAIAQAIANDPKHLTNRGVWSVFIRTTLTSRQKTTSPSSPKLTGDFQKKHVFKVK